jgi:hypothetical protein
MCDVRCVLSVVRARRAPPAARQRRRKRARLRAPRRDARTHTAHGRAAARHCGIRRSAAAAAHLHSAVPPRFLASLLCLTLPSLPCCRRPQRAHRWRTCEAHLRALEVTLGDGRAHRRAPPALCTRRHARSKPCADMHTRTRTRRHTSRVRAGSARSACAFSTWSCSRRARLCCVVPICDNSQKAHACARSTH